MRAVSRKWAKQGRLDRRTIIVGADEHGERLITALRAQEGSNLDILGVFDDRDDGRVKEVCAGVPKLGKVDDILEFAQRTRVDLILFALPISAERRIKNQGVTPAHITDLLITAATFPNGQPLPETPPHQRFHEVVPKAYLAANDFFHFAATMRLPNPAQVEEARRGMRQLLIFGYVDYIDQLSH